MPTIVHFDLPADDVERARTFYGELFDWKFEKCPGPMEYYLIETAALDGTGGVGGGMGERGEPGQQIVNYFGVSSLEECLGKIDTPGGKVILPKTAVPHLGYLAVCEDTEGNRFGIWEEDPAAA
ncbi:VOC family protein [Methanoculleus sp. FWC-SCC1]|uniref:VOC family protein n=1 Tax=Methanoculleus frigidifontis TaxID=2584085 RepID=A0ABT8M9G2_9EURY|nr:VOC family protein [Methanoculleus sp. FWC-SCC1]MDN7024568.1 VOC family protein [Methanoculleus sp. FWC-SCC1]